MNERFDYSPVLSRSIIRNRSARLVVLFLLIDSVVAFAQTPIFPDSLQSQSVVARTDRFSSTHNSSLSIDYRVNRDLFVGTFRTFALSSTTLSESPITRDELNILADLRYDLESPLDPFIIAEGTMTNDAGESELIDGINNTAATFLGVGARASDELGNHVGVAAGGAYNRQLNTEDAGGALYGEAVGRTELGGYDVVLESRARWYNTSPKTNGNLLADVSVDRDFGDGIYLNASGSLELLNNDLYIKRREEDVLQYGGLSYEGLRKRREHRTRVGLFFTYPVSTAVGFDANVSMLDEGLGRWETEEGLPPVAREPDPFRRDQEDFAIGGSIGAWYDVDRLRLRGRINYRSSEQQNLVEPTREVSEIELRRRQETSAYNDFVSSHFYVSGSAEYLVGKKDTVDLEASAGVYRYDTPDTTNNFDKDEASWRTELRYRRRFSRYLHFDLRGQVILTHLVYLFAENSNDNNWNRLFRLSPAVQYELPETMINVLRAELTANYTEYDFTERSQEIRGRSFRELAIDDSLVIFLDDGFGSMIRGELRISERGAFVWSQFAESLLERTRTELVEAELFKGRDTGLSYGLGGKLWRVETSSADPSGALQSLRDRLSVGPTARFRFPVSAATAVEATGWWEHRFLGGELVGRFPELFLSLRLRLGS